MIQGLIQMINQQTLTVSSQYPLRTAFFEMENYLRNNGQGMHEIIKGLLVQPSLTNDRSALINSFIHSLIHSLIYVFQSS